MRMRMRMRMGMRSEYEPAFAVNLAVVVFPTKPATAEQDNNEICCEYMLWTQADYEPTTWEQMDKKINVCYQNLFLYFI